MSQIDIHKHQHIGFLKCPMLHKLATIRSHDSLPVYLLKEDVQQDCDSLSGKNGDVVIGGGSGEARALSFAIPDIFTVYTTTNDALRWPPFTSYWTSNEAFIFGSGFQKLGWNPESEKLEIWLAEHLMAFLARIYPEKYKHLLGEFPLEQDGSIFIGVTP
ncbi:MAG: hypothetical protein WDN00_15475 [Limisphaerales bacterium]